MWFRLILGRRRSHAKPIPVNKSRLLKGYRPAVQVLEERLPPGDGVLGALLAAAWAGPGLALADCAPWASESLYAEAPPADRRPSPSAQGAALDEDPLLRWQRVPLVTFPSETGPRQAPRDQATSAPGLSSDRPGLETLTNVLPEGDRGPLTVSAGQVVYSGVAAGDPTSDSVILWTRALDPAHSRGLRLTADVSTDPTFATIEHTFTGRTNPNRDHTLKIEASGLQSHTRYYYRFQTADGQTSPVGTFQTAPEATADVGLHFAFSGDADCRWRPYVVTADFAQKNFDYFVFLGDTMYETACDISPPTADPFANPEQALLDYRRKYREQLEPVRTGGMSSLQTFFASQANYTLLDNHELGNLQFQAGGAPAGTPPGRGVDGSDPTFDVNRTGTFMNRTPGFREVLLRAYRDYQPIRERRVRAPRDPRMHQTQQLYLSQQWGRHSIFFNLDDRSYRDIHLLRQGGGGDTGPRADNPGRTMLGRTQVEWFKQGLLDAQAQGVTWKFVAVSSPIDQNGGDGNVTWIGGFRAERNELLKFIADNHIDHVVFLTTHSHLLRVNELTYLTDPKDPKSIARVPGVFQVLAGPFGASGPHSITDHSFKNIKALADDLAGRQIAQGIDPLGLDPKFPGLRNVVREGDPDADLLRQPADFYSPDTFNYATLGVGADGRALTVSVFGVDSFLPNTFPEPKDVGRERLILSFQVRAD